MHRVDVIHCLLINFEVIVVEHSWVEKLLQFPDCPIVLLALLSTELLNEFFLSLISLLWGFFPYFILNLFYLS